jgi:hypothetical protein
MFFGDTLEDAYNIGFDDLQELKLVQDRVRARIVRNLAPEGRRPTQWELRHPCFTHRHPCPQGLSYTESSGFSDVPSAGPQGDPQCSSSVKVPGGSAGGVPPRRLTPPSPPLRMQTNVFEEEPADDGPDTAEGEENPEDAGDPETRVSSSAISRAEPSPHVKTPVRVPAGPGVKQGSGRSGIPKTAGTRAGTPAREVKSSGSSGTLSNVGAGVRAVRTTVKKVPEDPGHPQTSVRTGAPWRV